MPTRFRDVGVGYSIVVLGETIARLGINRGINNKINEKIQSLGAAATWGVA